MLAVPLFVTGLITGGFVSSLVAASTVMLWLQPARDWFDGVTRPQADARRAAARTAARSDADARPRPARSRAPPQGRGRRRTARDRRTARRRRGALRPPRPRRHSAPLARPGVIVWACLLTWICSSLVALGMLASAVALAASPDLLFDELHRQNPELAEEGISDGFVTTVTYLMVAAVVAWCVGAAVLAWLVFRRVAWARIVLVVSCATCAALSLVGTLVGGIILVVPLAASVADDDVAAATRQPALVRPVSPLRFHRPADEAPAWTTKVHRPGKRFVGARSSTFARAPESSSRASPTPTTRRCPDRQPVLVAPRSRFSLR